MKRTFNLFRILLWHFRKFLSMIMSSRERRNGVFYWAERARLFRPPTLLSQRPPIKKDRLIQADSDFELISSVVGLDEEKIELN